MPSYVQMTAVAVNAPVTAAWANIIQGNLNYLADGNANILVITSGTGTITIPASVTKIYPFAKGGCGGGGGGSGGLGGGGGGGGGGIMDNAGRTVVAGDVLSYSIGVGGVAGAVGLGAGNGGATTFTLHGITHTAPGGGGGNGSSTGGTGGQAGNNFASQGGNGSAGAGGTGGGSIGGDMSGGAGGIPAGGAGTAGQNGFLIIRYSPISQGIGAASQTLDLTSADQLGEITSSEIIITGTWSGTRYITLPAGILSRNGHIIKNNSTGASAVAIVRTSGGTGVTFDSTTQGGKTTLVYSDGTNTYDATDSLSKINRAGDTMTGHLNVPTGATGTQVMQAQEVQSLIGSSGGGALTLYPDATVITAAGVNNDVAVHTLSRTPNTVTETIISGNATASVVALMGTFLDGPIGLTTVPAGEWDYPLYRYVDSSSNVSSITACVYLNKQQTGATIAVTGTGTSRTATVTGGTPFVAADYNADTTLTGYIQTPLGQYKIIGYTSTSVVTIETPAGYTNETGVAFTLDRHILMASSGEINDTTLTLQTFTATIPATPAITCDVTDRVCVRFHAVSTGTHTLYMYYGSQNNHYSHVHTTISQDVSQNFHAAPAVTTLQNADEFGIWNSLTSTLGKITAANIWAWINTKAVAGISSIWKFLTYIWFPNAGLVWMRGDPAVEAAERKYFDTHVNVLNSKSVTATYAAGVMTYTVGAGHGLSSGTTTDRVTVRGFDQADYNVTKSTYTYISATQFSVTTAGAPVSPATGATPLCYPLNLFENFYTFNVAIDPATGICAGRDITNFVRLLGTTEAGLEYEYYNVSAAAGTVPTWAPIFSKVLGAEYNFAGRNFSGMGNINPSTANVRSLGTSALYWLNIFTKLIEFTSATLGAITAGRVEYDGTDLWFSESATVRSPLNNTKYQINAQVGTTYSFVIGDKGKLVTFSNAAAITATVEPSATTNFPIGTIIRVAQDGAGKLTIAAGAGVTINSLAGNKAMAGQYSDATLVKEAADTWYLFGNLIA